MNKRLFFGFIALPLVVSFTAIQLVAEEAPAVTHVTESVAAPAIAPDIDPEYIALLEKRVELAKENLGLVKLHYDTGTKGGSAGNLAAATRNVCDAQIALLKYTGNTRGEDMIAILEERLAASRLELGAVEAAYEHGRTQDIDLGEARLRVAEAQYDLKQARRRKDSAVSAAGQTPLPRAKTLRYQGKIFEQWREEVRTELDPKIRIEAVQAFALFGTHGRAEEAVDAIFETVREYDFRTGWYRNASMQLKAATVDVFHPSGGFIPVKTYLPFVLEKMKHGSANEQSLAIQILYLLGNDRNADAQLNKSLAECCRHLAKKQVGSGASFPNISEDFYNLMVNSGGIPDVEETIAFYRDALERNDEELFFLGTRKFDPDDSPEKRGKVMGVHTGPDGFFGFSPRVLRYSDGIGVRRIEFSPFGKAFLKLLEEEGVTSKNEAIRKHSEMIVRALQKPEKELARKETSQGDPDQATTDPNEQPAP